MAFASAKFTRTLQPAGGGGGVGATVEKEAYAVGLAEVQALAVRH